MITARLDFNKWNHLRWAELFTSYDKALGG